MPPSGSGSLPARFRVGEWVVDSDACSLVKGGAEVHLRPLLMDLLVLLASRYGEAVTKDEILDRIWEKRFLSDSVLSRTVAELRRIMGDTSGRPRIIETIRKRGYRLIAPVEALPGVSEPRLAVLPFENLNRDPEYDYFAAGISDALTTELGNVNGLQVVSRHSVLALARTERTLAGVARRLRVGLVLEGSALHAGSRVRISAQLIRAEPEHHIWARSYTSEIRDILELQGRVARSVAEAVQTTLTPMEVARLSRRRTVNPEAHLAYLKGRYHALRWDREGLEKGLAYTRQALQIDPSYAPAYALLANVFTVLGYWGHLPVEVAYPQAKQAAARAIRLDPFVGEAHALMGLMYWLMDWDLNGCERELQEASQLSPSSELVHGFYALFLAVSRDDPARAASHIRTLLDLDPLSMHSNFSAAWLHFFCRDYREAIGQARSTLEMYPQCLHAHYVIGWVALAENRYVEAITAFENAAALSRDAVSVAYVATAYGRSGKRNVAHKALDELSARRDAEDVPEFLFAIVQDAVGNRDGALESLERCYTARDSRIFWFKHPPIGGSLIGDPRFRELMHRVDLAVQDSSRRTAAVRP
jgi:TolB-like protein